MEKRNNEGIIDVEVKTPHLLFDKEFNTTGLDDQPVIRENLDLSRNLTREEIKEAFAICNNSRSRGESSPMNPEPIKLDTCEDMAEFWKMVHEMMPEDQDYKNIAESWVNSVREKKEKLDALEDEIKDINDPDLYKLAGIEDSGAEIILGPPAREEIAKKIADDKKYPKNLSIDFSGDYLTINKVPTNIATVFVKNAYIGLSGLFSHERSIKIVSKIVKKKLDPLFDSGISHGN